MAVMDGRDEVSQGPREKAGLPGPSITSLLLQLLERQGQKDLSSRTMWATELVQCWPSGIPSQSFAKRARDVTSWWESSCLTCEVQG